MRTFLCSAALCCLIFTTLSAQPQGENTLEALLKKAADFHTQGDFESAKTLLEKGLSKSKTTKSDSMQVVFANKLGFNCEYLGDYEQAESYYLEALETCKASLGEQHIEYCDVASNLGVLYVNNGDFESAEPLLTKAMAISLKHHGAEAPKYANSLGNMALFFEGMGLYDEAEDLFLQAISIYKNKQEENSFEYATLLSNLAVIYKITGKLEQALQIYLQVVELDKINLGEENPDYAGSLNNLAMIYKGLKRYNEAEELLLKVLAIDKANFGDKHPYYASSLNNLSTLYSSVENYPLAKKYMLEVLAIDKANFGDKHPNYASSLENIADIYKNMRLFKEAENAYQSALTIKLNTFGEKHPKTIRSFNHLGKFYTNYNNDKSLSFFLRSIITNCEDAILDSTTLLKDISILRQYSFAENAELMESLKGLHDLVLIQYNSSKNPAQLQWAYTALQIALDINKKLLKELTDDKDKLRKLANTNRLISHAISTGKTLCELGKEEFLASSFDFVELNKSVLLSDAIKGNRARRLGDIPQDLALQEIALQEDKKTLEKAQIEAKTEQEKSAVAASMNELNLEINAFKKQLEAKFPKYYQLKYADINVSAKELQSLLKEKTVFLEYFVADTTLYLFALTQKTLNFYAFSIEKEQLNKQTSDLRKALSDYDFIKNEPEKAAKLYRSTAYWFYQNILSKALDKLNDIEHLIVVADGELGHLPFESFLTDERASDNSYKNLPYLVRKYSISYNYSATLWKENLTSTPKKNNAKILAIAPSYAKTEAATQTRTVRAPHLRNLRDALIDLPSAKIEVEKIKAMANSDAWFDKAANERGFKQKAADYSIIHLAMHGLLNTQHPILSSLAFSEDGDSTEDNFLQAYEIAQLQLNAQLVVLSACETGYGKFQQGEGVMSLARSFMYAGVPSLVVSMWQVNDESTAFMMQFFYENLGKGMNKAEALRAAKLHYIELVPEEAAHPAFWAAFVQLGDNRPVEIGVRSSFAISQKWIWGTTIGTMALGLAFGGFALSRRRK